VQDDGAIAARALDAGTQDDIHRAMQAARDVGRYGLSQLDVDGKPVTVLSVARRREGFAQTSAGVVRVRRTRDDPLFGAELVRFANERTSSRYETTEVDVELGGVSPALRTEIARALRLNRATSDRLRAAELATGERLTVAGALYLLPDPSRILGKAFVEVLRFPDDSSVDYDRREQVEGPLHHVLEETVRRVARELGTELVVLGTRRYELSRLPEVVLREAIANALAHRSYEAAGTAVRVELRPSAVVVRSPGGLPEPVTVENIRETTAARNLVVIRVLRALGLAEDVGRGVDVMQDTMAAEMLRDAHEQTCSPARRCRRARRPRRAASSARSGIPGAARPAWRRQLPTQRDAPTTCWSPAQPGGTRRRRRPTRRRRSDQQQ
jgi:ATP-dependent DNA helicase RecG